MLVCCIGLHISSSGRQLKADTVSSKRKLLRHGWKKKNQSLKGRRKENSQIIR